MELQEPQAVDSDPIFTGEEPATSAPPRDSKGRFTSPSTEPADATPEPAKPALSGYRQRLNAEALDLGFTEDELQDFSDQGLSTALGRIMRERISRQDEALRERAIHEQSVKKPQPVQPAEEPQDDLDGFDPKLVSALNAAKTVGKKSMSEVEMLRAKVEQLEQKEQARSQSQVAELIDDAFDMLGEKYEAVLGKGPGRELGEANKSQFRRRIALLQEIGVDFNNMPSRRTLAAKLLEAAEMLYGPALEGSKKQKAAEPAKPTENDNPYVRPTQTMRPTNRTATQMPKGDHLAVTNLAERMRQQRESEAIPDSEELEGFIG